jgi:serine/threonine protein kinase
VTSGDDRDEEERLSEARAVNETRTKLGLLVLRVSKLRTFHNSSTEVSLYENHYAGRREVGKRVDSLDRPFTKRLLEARTQARLDHPNLVPIYSVQEVLHLPFQVPPEARPIIEIFTPYYERGSVFDALDSGHRFSISETLAVGRAAARGLAELHDNGLVHRDVKSPNIFLANNNTVAKVGDLGEVAEVDVDRQAPGLDAPLPWTAPEQIRDQRADVRSDLFGLGMTMLEMLNGLLPHDDFDPLDWKRRLEQGWTAVPPRFLTHRPTTPPRLRSLVNRMIDHRPDRRPDSTHEVLGELRMISAIDWALVVNEAHEKRWEGTSPRSNMRYAVRATWRPRLRTWDVFGERRVNAWQRCSSVHRVPSLDECYAVFDEVLRVAVSDAR